MPRASAADAARTAARILQSASCLFATRGYAQVSLDDIAHDAGVTRGAIYHHYQSKKGLFSAVAARLQAEVAEAVVAAAEASPSEQLRAGSHAFLDTITSRDFARILLVDAPSVVGWQEWRRLDDENSVAHLREALLNVQVPESLVDAPYLRAFVDACGQDLPDGWLAEHLGIAIDEYEKVWMNPATHLTAIGLNRYFGEGQGRPKETEPGHFDFELQKYARKHGLDVREFERRYDDGDISEPELDQYFVHDRSMRESGLDTTTRFDNCCADLACVDLNSILYRVETDIADLIEKHAGGRFEHDGTVQTPADWRQKAERRQALMKQYLWSETDGTYHDYNVRTGKPQPFVSASNLMPLWAGCCTPDDARRLVDSQLPQLLRPGGIASTGPVDKSQPGPERQWDAPYGWAPHQIMIWEGLARYGFTDQARNAAFAWLQMLVRAAVEYNGLITEKFNVENRSHKVDAEYGNVGARFEYLPAGGFGWTNTSFLLGLHYLDDEQKAQLDALADTVDTP